MLIRKSSTANQQAALVTDGIKSDASAWQSGDGEEKEKWLEIDLGNEQELGSAVIYTGSDGGTYTAPDRIKNFSLQYLKGEVWTAIPGMVETNNKYAQVFTVFKQAITARKIRFVSTDKGNLKVREIKVFAKGDGPSGQPDFNVSGIQRTGEVVRLFAKGFKDERKLLQTESNVEDSDLDTYTSFDEHTGNYYMWLVQRGLADYHLQIDLNQLKLSAGIPITAETVNDKNYGEVTQLIKLAANGKFDFTLAPQSVVLLTIPSGKLTPNTLIAKAAVHVTGGKQANSNFSTAKQMEIQLDASNPSNNQVAYTHFDLAPSQAKRIKRAVLSVNGSVDQGKKPYRLHVYGIPQKDFNAQKLTWNNAMLLDRKEALLKEVGTKAFIAGEIAFDQIKRNHYLDVTDLLKKHTANGFTFVLVRETRQLGDDEDKGRKVGISPVKSSNPPTLQIWQ
jgi:hypothetical protein